MARIGCSLVFLGLFLIYFCFSSSQSCVVVLQDGVGGTVLRRGKADTKVILPRGVTWLPHPTGEEEAISCSLLMKLG